MEKLTIDQIRTQIATVRVMEFQLLNLVERINNLSLRSCNELQKVEIIELQLLIKIHRSAVVEYDNYTHKLCNNWVKSFEGID